MAKPTVIVVGADKGGVGKTTVSRTLLDYFTAHHVPTRAFDTESPKGTLKRFHPDISDIVDVTSVPDQMRIFDTLSTTDASVTVIDVRAGLLSPTLRSLRDIGFLDAVKKGQLTFAVFHILGSSIASLNEIEDTSTFTADGKYFLVKNFINNTSFFEWDQADPLLLFQETQGRRRDHHPEAQRDGLRAGGARFRSVPHLRRQQGPEGRSGQLLVRAARLCPALARQCLGRVRPHQAQRDRGERRSRAGTGPRVQVVSRS